MASVFSASVQTQTRPNGVATDGASSPLSFLDTSNMTSVSALGGTMGTCTARIHGDVWDQFEGNDTKNVLKDDKLTVFGNRLELIKTNHQHTIVGTTNTKHIGVHNHVNVSPRNDTYVHTRTEDHHQPEQIHQPTSLMNIQKTVTEYLEHHTKFSSWYFTMVAFNTSIYPVLSLGYASMEGKLGIIATKALLLEKKSKALDVKFQGATTKFTMTAILASALWAKVIAFDGNAGIAANADSPFA
jgi:hypothetical protein